MRALLRMAAGAALRYAGLFNSIVIQRRTSRDSAAGLALDGRDPYASLDIFGCYEQLGIVPLFTAA